MSLLPLIFGDNYYRPSRILDQHFGLGLDPEDLFSPVSLLDRNMFVLRNPAAYFRPWRTMASRGDTGSTVNFDKDKFQVNLDVQQFSPEEITVKVTGENTLTIEAKHEEKQDEHGFISRHFVRKYVIPKDHDMGKIESKLSSDGVLTITAPRTNAQELDHRNIPIAQTGVPSRAVENRSQDKKMEN